MEKRMKGSSRVLSFVLALCLIIGMLPMMAPSADAVYNTNNAPAADAELLDKASKLFAATPGGAMLRVVDGKLYVWGKNTRYGLGLKTYNGEPTTQDTIVPEPVLHDYYDYGGGFDGNIIEIEVSNANDVTILTDTGYIYSWGELMGTYAVKGYDSRYPVEWDLSNIPEGRTIVEMESNSPVNVAVMDDEGNWYTGGSEQYLVKYYDMVDWEKSATMYHIAERFIDKLQPSYPKVVSKEIDELPPEEQAGGKDRVTIERLIPIHQCGAQIFVTSNGKLFGMGYNASGTHLLPDKLDASGKVIGIGDARTPVDVLAHEQNAEFAAANPDLSTTVTSGGATAFIDESGNVWMCGQGHIDSVDFNRSYYFYPNGTNFRRAQKVYNAKDNGVKAVKVFLASSVAVFLTADNSLYAIGLNTNQFITNTKTSTEYVHDYTQVFTSLSKQQTIVGVYPTNKGVMVLTESGEQYWAGSNENGSAGNPSINPAPGEVVESATTTLPPVEPLSKNEIIFEIEDAGGNTYISAEDEDGSSYILKNRNTTAPEELEFDKDEPILKAGEIFKLNVYFNDFKKINTFVVPIRFDPRYVRVVNGSGEPYAENTVVTPGAIGESVGITKGFDANTWPGGLLHGDGGQKGTYPKICNTNGWVSVMGSADGKPAIQGEQLMFSIYFTALKATDVEPTGDNYFTKFKIARKGDTAADVGEGFSFTTTNNLYTHDDTGMVIDDWGAGWIVTNTANPDLSGYYTFGEAEEVDAKFLPVRTSFVGFNSISLSIHDENDADYENYGSMNTGSDGTSMDGYLISNKNTSTVYTIKSTTDTDASFPQVTWGSSLESTHDVTMTSVADFITIVEQGDTYIRFKVRDGYDRTDVGAIKFVATSVKKNDAGKQVTDNITVLIGDVAAPTSIAIAEKADYPNGVTYHSVTGNDVTTLFTATFPDAEDGFAATAVVWRLFDAKGNELKGAANDTVVLSNTTPSTGKFGDSTYTAPTATVRPVHTTFNDDHVVLRVESVYDSSVYDEITIKVHLNVTSLTFTQTTLRLPTNTSRDLSTLLRIGPENDYYDADLEWTYDPANPDSPHLVFDGTSVISARGVAHTAGADIEYDTITVTDKLTGDTVSAAIKIYVIDLNSPIKPNQVEVHNLVGDLGDYIYVKSGLEPGDTITFYKTYGTEKGVDGAKEGVDWVEFVNLKEAHTPDYKFPAPEGFLIPQGGEIAMTVTRGGDTKDKVPLLYDPEPSKVSGYISLSGKNAVSARNAGIAVQLIDGPSNPGVVYTDNKGYFEYETYILPGTYSLLVYHDNYLRRIIQPDEQVGYTGIVIPSATDYAISTEDNPIVLYPGDVNVDGAINGTDINYYVRYWVGQSNTALSQFANFDFYDGPLPVVDLYDLNLLLGRSGWVTEAYPKWYVPSQK